jgi:hypothetical protein
MPTMPDSKLIAFVGKSASIGGARVKTASYMADVNDSGMLLSFNSSTAVTLTLPATPPNFRWCIAVENIGAGALTVNRNGLTIDGAAANFTLTQTQGSWIFTDGSNYLTERGSGGNSGGLRKYAISWNAQTSITISHPLATTDISVDIWATTGGGANFGSLVGAFTDSGGNVVEPLDIGNGPVSFIVPTGATQLQLGFNDSAWFDNSGSWVVSVNGSNYTVQATAQPWLFTGGINSAYPTGTANDGTAPTVITGLTAGSTVTVAYVSGATSGGGPYAVIYDANGVSGTYGGLPNPGGYAGGLPYLKDEAESCTITGPNSVVLTFGAPFTGRAVIIG